MPKSRSNQLVDKSIEAMVSAIETYNRPDHRYREETFCVLALSAWELLVKAKVLLENKNRLSAIHEFEYRTLRTGTRSAMRYIKRNRSGNPSTIGLWKAIGIIENSGVSALAPEIRANLEGLTEVRDNAVHYINDDLGLAKKVQELGAASLQNYVRLLKRWFDRDMSRYNFFLMPLGFFRDFSLASVVPISTSEQNLLDYLSALSSRGRPGPGTDFHVVLELELHLKRSAAKSAAEVVITNDPSATPVYLREEDLLAQFPWDYAELTDRLRRRYSDFKADQRYHDIRKKMVGNQKLVQRRYLDPGNPRSSRKDFYSPNVVQTFDQHYTRRSKWGEG